jgi:hypothetical protein
MDPRIAPQPGPRPVAVGAGSAPVLNDTVLDDTVTDPAGIPVQAGTPVRSGSIPAQRVVPDAAVEPSGAPAPAVAAKRGRPRWMWVALGAVVLVAAACGGWALLAGGPAVTDGVKAVQVQVGATAASASGLEFTVTAPQPYQPANSLLLDKGDTAYGTTLTVLNDSGDVAPASRIVVAATVGGRAAPQVFDQTFLSTQPIPAGQRLEVPFRFRVPQGVTGSLQITISESGVPTVIVNGTL